MSTENKIGVVSKVLLLLAAVFLAANIFLPIWKIELYAPQYPEGLVLLIYANTLGGSVDIINGLNHYIGMQTLHAENFIEFSILRYIIGFFVLAILFTAIIGRKKAVYILFTCFALFGVIAMVDFYRWNYNYGHNLDPNAAIVVPGMAYQPPIIGYKQLLNFGAYSMPDTGGMLFIGCGILLLLVVLIERNVFAKWIKRKPVNMTVMVGAIGLSLASCAAPGPRPIVVNKDTCAYCKMNITSEQFCTQLITQKGRIYVFDDLVCMADYKKENTAMEYDHFYTADFTNPSVFVDLEKAFLIQSDSLRSPMGGNTAGFAVQDSAIAYKSRLSAADVTWADLVR